MRGVHLRKTFIHGGGFDRRERNLLKVLEYHSHPAAARDPDVVNSGPPGAQYSAHLAPTQRG